MKISNFAQELAEQRVEDERNTAIAKASGIVGRIGGRHCHDCGTEIRPERKQAAPFARRCLDCQTEQEKWGR